MAAKTNAFEIALLNHIFLNSDITLIGDAAGLQNSATEGSLYIALLTGDPGEAGDIINNEVDTGGGEYAQYTRIAVARNGTTGWETDGGNGLQNKSEIAFPEMTSGSNVTIQYVAICTGSTVQTDDALYYAAVDSNLLVSSGVTPTIAAGSLVITED